MTPPQPRLNPAPPREPSPGRSPADGGRTLLMGLVLVAALAAVVYPLQRYGVEPARQALLGYHETPGWRLAMASQFGFSTAGGASVRLVPGSPALELADLPSQAVTVILGGFRGPYVVWLWIKVEEEKRQKVHFDLIDRYTKIAALQSDYPEMWVYHAWNLAYNLPAQWQSLERRYQWICRAVEFLNEGNRKNPHSAQILYEMGRLYSEKLGRSQEAAYYRRRVKEDEGRSTFLIGYEWFDRARKANERYSSLGRNISKPVAYSQACHSLSYYAQELSQDVYDTFQQSVEARDGGREDQARQAFELGRRKLADAISAWRWAEREWYDQALRFEKEGAPGVLLGVYRRFYGEAGAAARQMEALQQDLTYETLPETFRQMVRPEIK